MSNNTILVVDDEIGIRELLSEILRDEGYRVALAENAGQARNWRKQTRPDLVLLDIWMPDTDGITLLKEWASCGLLTMPVVMMSGHGTIDTAVEATRMGASGYLEKPVPLQKLLSTVGRALRGGQVKSPTILPLASLGRGPLIADLKKRLEQVTGLRTPLLLTGEPGTGVDLCARFCTAKTLHGLNRIPSRRLRMPRLIYLIGPKEVYCFSRRSESLTGWGKRDYCCCWASWRNTACGLCVPHQCH